MQKPPVKFTLAHGAIMPTKATDGSAAYDLVSPIEVLIESGTRQVIDIGLSIEMTEDMAALILSRSGYAMKHGIVVANVPGLIDSDYRGRIKVALANNDAEDFVVRRGSRIAQLLFVPVVNADLVEVESLSDTHRGSGGFGSTGQ